METNLYKYVAEEVYMYTPIIWWWLDPKRWIQQYAGNSFEKVDHPKGYPSYRITRFERRFRASLSSEDPKVRVMARRASSMPAPPLENGETWERRASQTCRWNRNVSFKLLWLAMWRFQGGKFSMFSSDIYKIYVIPSVMSFWNLLWCFWTTLNDGHQAHQHQAGRDQLGNSATVSRWISVGCFRGWFFLRLFATTRFFTQLRDRSLLQRGFTSNCWNEKPCLNRLVHAVHYHF